jgi:fatty aldehyde-generating acyl-ACP reductase
MSQPGKFAFIMHPLTIADVTRKYPALRYVPGAISGYLLRKHGPFIVSQVTGVRSLTGAEIEGVFVGCPLTSEMLLHGDPDANTREIIRCGRIAEELGAKIVGLGAFTSVVGDAGVTIARELDIAVTSGNTYTVATALEGAIQATELLGRDTANVTAAVVGAAGSIGKACARLLVDHVAKLTLVDLQREPLEALAASLSGHSDVAISTEPTKALLDQQLVVTVTSAVTPIIGPEHLMRGAVVCDVARPRDVSVRVAKQRPDVLVIEGGVVAVPGDVDFGIDFGFPPKTAYACMSETMILALEGRFEDYTIGRDLSVEKVAEIRALASKHGFRLAGFRSFERAVTEETIERVRRLSREG